ncbi:hypothetical protein Ddye_026966 [Dipteronia dyeriana]|uniref:Uncharacterized protein n=1 Tax=Dipteronia dyeriana TaxID=168575 RepID=A0AAD9TNU9_9ROSI|nr:hypothetical protein Ddye_026966 [Dipteronia dyeriana]
MIPTKYLLKMGIYEVECQGTKVKAILVDHEAFLDAKIVEFKTSLQNQGCPVVGIDFKVNSCDKKVELVILCGQNHCLLIKVPKIHSFPLSLQGVLADRNLCFVGTGIPDKLPGLTLGSENWVSVAGQPRSFYMNAIVEVCDLAAKVLKKPKLCKCGLAELDTEVRINSTVASTASSWSPSPVTDSKVMEEKASLPEMIKCIPDWKAVVFSDEDIKYAIYDACTCCFIGYKMLELLDATN